MAPPENQLTRMIFLVAAVCFQTTLARDNFIKEAWDNIWGAMPAQNRWQCKMQGAAFPCTYFSRSYPTPTNVNNLQPADIDIVVALGDSVIASVGAVSTNIFKIYTEFRGISFAGGGLGNWESVVTLPNILRLFNPQLEGGSTVFGPEHSEFKRGNHYNLAVTGSTSLTLIDQAIRLVRLMNTPRNRNRWKVVTIQIGHNDVCLNPCNSTMATHDASPYMFGRRLKKALDYIRDHMTRAFVNLLPATDITFSEKLITMSPVCEISVPFVCPCLFGGYGSNGMTRDKFIAIQKGYVDELYELVNSNRYEREDFTVVIQPSFAKASLYQKYSRRLRKKVPDMSFFGPDCLHPSQKLHALMARGLWNNMLSPEGFKQIETSKVPPFLCPSPASPYLATRLNSKHMNITDMARDFSSYMQKVAGSGQRCHL